MIKCYHRFKIILNPDPQICTVLAVLLHGIKSFKFILSFCSVFIPIFIHLDLCMLTL